MKTQTITDKVFVIGLLTKNALASYMQEVKDVLTPKRNLAVHQPEKIVESQLENAVTLIQPEKENLIDSVTFNTQVNTFQHNKEYTGKYELNFNSQEESICGITLPSKLYEKFSYETSDGNLNSGRYANLFRRIMLNPSVVAIESIFNVLLNDEINIDLNGNFVCKSHYNRLYLVNAKGNKTKVNPKDISFIHDENIVTVYKTKSKPKKKENINTKSPKSFEYNTFLEQLEKFNSNKEFNGEFELMFDLQEKSICGIDLPENFFEKMLKETKHGQTSMGGYARLFRRILKNPNELACFELIEFINDNKINIDKNGTIFGYTVDGANYINDVNLDKCDIVMINPRMIISIDQSSGYVTA